MSNEDDIIEIVDELADELNPVRVEREAERLGVTVEELLHRVAVEVQTRIGP